MSSLFIPNTSVFEQNPLRPAGCIYQYRWKGSNFIDNKAQRHHVIEHQQCGKSHFYSENQEDLLSD